MLYLAALFFILTLLACAIAFGGGMSREIAGDAEYAAAMFAFAFFAALVGAYTRPPKP